MILENVMYRYRRDLDRWLIIFPTRAEAQHFESVYSEGKYKPYLCTFSKTVTETTRYRAIYAQLTGRFEQLRQLYRAKGMRDTIVDDLESDGTFDRIDLTFDTKRGFASFRIGKFETWTDWDCKCVLNAEYGASAGYYDTDTVGQGGVCSRRSCCGIGFDPNVHKTDTERIMFSVKDYCPNGKADIVKVSAWTNTFIGTNKENEKEYSWIDFKQYMQKLSANGSDIWDIEWEYDEFCPFTGTEVADKLHLYLKPLAYKRLFEEKEKEEPKQLIDATLKAKNSTTEPHIFFNNKVMTLTEFNEFINATNNKEENTMGPKDTTFAEFCRRLYWGQIDLAKVKPTKILIQGTATIIWWSDGTKTVVKCQKGDKMDPEKGIAMCVMKKFMGTNKTGSNYLDFAKPAIKDYESKQKAMAAARKKAADKKRRAVKAKTEAKSKEES